MSGNQDGENCQNQYSIGLRGGHARKPKKGKNIQKYKYISNNLIIFTDIILISANNIYRYFFSLVSFVSLLCPTICATHN